jgi:FMN phosphatase YigB (HAD superfamily)
MTLSLLFDLDDTLLDSNIDALIPVYFQKLAAHMAATVPPEKMLKELMRATMVMYANTRVDQTLEQVFSDQFYPPLGTSQAAAAAQIDQFYDEIFPTLQPLTQPRPEAVELVQWALAQGWNVNVATDPLFPRKAILHRLRWANLAPENVPFGLISDFQTFHFAKASVAYFPEFLSLMKWDGISPVLMVGDSIERDVVPARKAGIPVFWLKSDGQFAPEAVGIPQGTLSDLKTFLATTDHSTLKADFSSPTALLAVLQAVPALFHHLIRTTSPNKWALRPAEGEWAFTEILCHMRDVEIEVNLPRVDAVLAGNNPIVTGQVTDPWAEARNYIQQDVLTAFCDFVTARNQLVAKLQALSPQEWERPARHTIFGPTHLRELVGFMIEHDLLHIRQAQAALA